MRYHTFTGKNKQEAYALLKAEKNIDPQFRNAIIIKDSEKTVSTFMGLKQEKIYELVVGISEHTTFPTPETKKEIKLEKPLTHIEKSVINNRPKPTFSAPNKIDSSVSPEAQDTLFAIDGITKVAQQISKLETTLPKQTTKNVNKIEKTPAKSKEIELKKELNIMRNEFQELKVLITNQQQAQTNSQIFDSLQDSRTLPNEYEIQKQHINWIEKHLTDREFSSSLIDDVVQTLNPEVLNDKASILKSVETFLLENIPQTDISLDNYKYGNEIIFIGATGVGKTSTLVKLAAHLSMMRKKTFRFISIDKYKVGGDAQLEKLASYMNTNFHSINKQEEFYSLLADNNDQFTFIDTAGKGPKDSIAIQELSHWISMIGHPIDTHLVVSATTKFTDLEFICDSYKVVDYNHLLVTKLDETKTLGSIISLSYKYQKSLSFVTDGQEIPQDFEIANIRSLIKEALK